MHKLLILQVRCMYTFMAKAIGTVFWDRGGGGLRCKAVQFVLSHLHFKRIKLCKLESVIFNVH